MSLIKIFNIFSLCLSVSFIFISFLGSENKIVKSFFINFFSLVCIELIFLKHEFFIIYFIFIFLIFNYYILLKDKFRAVFNSLSVVFIFSSSALFFSVLVQIFRSYNQNAINKNDYIISSILILFSIVISFFIKKFKHKINFYNKKSKYCVLAWLILNNLIFAVGLPNMVIDFNIYTYYFNMILIITINTITIFLIIYILELEKTEIINIESQKYSEILKKNTEEKELEVIKINHYYKNLLQNLDYFINEKDLESIEIIYSKYIQPEYESFNKKIDEKDIIFERINLIKPKLIRSLIFDTKLKISLLNNQIEFLFKINSPIMNFNNIDEFDLFKIFSIYINNAMEELSLQSMSNNKFLEIAIETKNSNHEINILIENSIGELKKTEHHGLGLIIANEIISKYKNINVETKTLINSYLLLIIIN